MRAVRTEQHQCFGPIIVNYVVNIFVSHPIYMENMFVMHTT
jgi:hypothetical protein